VKGWRIIVVACALLWGSVDAFALRSTTPEVIPENGCTADFDSGVSRARYYQPTTGRFWTGDTDEGEQDDPLSLHKYPYAEDDPVNHSDPLGQDMWVGRGNTAFGLHQTFNIGNPNGTYDTFDFGLPHGIWSYPWNILFNTKGVIYHSAGKPHPTILYQYGYLRTTPSQDVAAVTEMMALVGKKMSFGLLSYNCHDFAQGAFNKYAAEYPNELHFSMPAAGSWLICPLYLDIDLTQVSFDGL
jgi:RHS repeat-associated protein